MKGNFWKGVVATVLAGVVLFLAQDLYTKATNPRGKSVAVTFYEETFSLNKAALDAIASEDRYRADFSFVRVSNTGDRDLRAFKLMVGSELGGSPEFIRVEEVHPFLPANEQDIVLKWREVGDLIEIDLPTIRAEEHVDLMIARECCVRLYFVPKDDSVKIEQSSQNLFDEDSSDLSIIWFVIFMMVAALFGFWTALMVTSSVKAQVRGTTSEDD